MMRSSSLRRTTFKSSGKQSGVVLFFALIALVVMSLAAVALIRSVDTSTMISGNLALRQAATTSGDGGVEAAMSWLNAEIIRMQDAHKKELTDPTHTFNNTAIYNALQPTNPVWYHSSVGTIAALTNGTINWDNTDSAPALTDAGGNSIADASGNKVRYIIERMCRNPNTLPDKFNCLFTTSKSTLNDQKVVAADEVCVGAGCLPDAQSTQLRITARVVGPRNTTSYIQAFVY
jgi:Tfp pilus assembly protein PilX